MRHVQYCVLRCPCFCTRPLLLVPKPIPRCCCIRHSRFSLLLPGVSLVLSLQGFRIDFVLLDAELAGSLQPPMPAPPPPRPSKALPPVGSFYFTSTIGAHVTAVLICICAFETIMHLLLTMFRSHHATLPLLQVYLLP